MVVLSITLEWFMVLKRCLMWKNTVEFGFLQFSWDGLKRAYYLLLFAYLGPMGFTWDLLRHQVIFVLGLLGLLGICEARRRYGW
jgi:hypothetical protein